MTVAQNSRNAQSFRRQSRLKIHIQVKVSQSNTFATQHTRQSIIFFTVQAPHLWMRHHWRMHFSMLTQTRRFFLCPPRTMHTLLVYFGNGISSIIYFDELLLWGSLHREAVTCGIEDPGVVVGTLHACEEPQCLTRQLPCRQRASVGQ